MPYDFLPNGCWPSLSTRGRMEHRGSRQSAFIGTGTRSSLAHWLMRDAAPLAVLNALKTLSGAGIAGASGPYGFFKEHDHSSAPSRSGLS